MIGRTLSHYKVLEKIAEGLEAAHEKGVIHRDLKPANIKVTPDGKVKVLDFGLAKAFGDEPREGNMSESPTATFGATRAGIIMGTAPYMSPEQARGKDVDKRTDIWAFGCGLYEALTSKQTFGGETVTDVTAAILHTDPFWEYLPPDTPQSIVGLLSRCLEKDRSLRLRDIGEARITLDRDLDTSSDIGNAVPFERKRVAWALWALLGAMVTVVGFLPWILTRENPGPGPTAHFLIETPSEGLWGGPPAPTVAISPDGSHIVLVGSRFYLRSIDEKEARPIPGTQDGAYPFFSPDSQWIGFFVDGKLQKISTRGGPPQVLCEAPQGAGGSWGPDDTIVFTPTYTSGLYRISATGGDPESVTTPNEREIGHLFPRFLPGGKEVLFMSLHHDQQIDVVSLETRERKTILENASMPFYSPTGHLVFARRWTLMAAPFDLSRLEITGSSAPLFEGIWQSDINSSANYGLSDNGTIVYVKDVPQRESSLVSVDRQGKVQKLVTRPGLLCFPQLSPDGKRIAVTINSGTPSYSAWVYDLARGTLSLFDTRGAGAIWTPDGASVTFFRDGSIHSKPSDGSGGAEALLLKPLVQAPNSWSHDGKLLAYTEFHPDTGQDLWVYPSGGEPVVLLNSSFDEQGGRFSPDGKWLAYVTSESGKNEVYVTQYPGPGGKWQISAQGGLNPIWAQDGHRLYYLNESEIFQVTIETDPDFKVSEPTELYSGPIEYGVAAGVPNYDVSHDGLKVFLFHAESQDDPKPRKVHVVLNWFEGLNRLVPTNN